MNIHDHRDTEQHHNVVTNNYLKGLATVALQNEDPVQAALKCATATQKEEPRRPSKDIDKFYDVEKPLPD